MKYELGKTESENDDLYVIPIIEIFTEKRNKDSKGSEMHLIAHSITFDN